MPGSKKSKWVKTKLPEPLYKRVEEYAARHGLSIYTAVRRLIEEGLRGSADLVRLSEDRTLILLAVRYLVLRDPGFREEVLKLVGDEEL